MKNFFYEAPQLEVLDLVVEQGFAASVNSSVTDYDGFEDETPLF